MDESNFTISDRGPAVLIVDAVGLGLALITAILRGYVRIVLLKAFGGDDWLMMAAMATFAAYCAFSISGVAYGTGQHVYDVPADYYSKAKMWWWCCYLSYSATMFLSKLSIAWFLLRVTINRVHRWIIHSAVIITGVSCAAFFFVSMFQCNPVDFFWTQHRSSPPTGTCIDPQVVVGLAYMFSVFCIISDFTFALLPAWIVSHLNMKRKTKFALIALMGLGCFGSAAVAVRFPYMRHIASDDFLYDTADIAIWSTVEQALAITAGCLATLQPLVKKVAFKLGLASTPMMSGAVSNSGSGFKNLGEISVRRSFTLKRTDGGANFSAMMDKYKNRRSGRQEEEEQGEAVKLKLQPGISEYSAVCFNSTSPLPAANSSQEELRPKAPRASSSREMV
ncbi:hypothetical protein QBC35DRAFT_97819 [Podospora australis]|uniref:Rhodopsin domain-containing protein n=1 Tax=Podospora australis TaxID=1536484 RepID=A0AAN6WNF7_9PEZI|nr:hypothetical protein QBC35DRAFT_97819 [Podospora australis]